MNLIRSKPRERRTTFRLPSPRSVVLPLVVAAITAVSAAGAEYYRRQSTWPDTMLASRAALMAASTSNSDQAAAAAQLWFRSRDDFPAEWDWTLQDGGEEFAQWFCSANSTERERRMIQKVLAELGEAGGQGRETLAQLIAANTPATDRRWLELYATVCGQRRAQRLRTVRAKAPRILFVKHHTLRPSFFAYTEGQSDAQNERHFLPGSELCLLELDRAKPRTLLKDPGGAIRDPAVSWDGLRVVFAWKKSLDNDDYHLYELDLASNQVVQLTFGIGFADYEPAFLPNDDLIFASTRCVQTVDCWWTEASALYTCDARGQYLRRLGFDQVHTLYPQVMDDGRVIYTRWDYNDRGQIFPQPLFQMYADGTGQTEFYGNNSWFPTTLIHARGIPGTRKALAVLGGHHTPQAGKLAVIDPARGRHENSGVQLVAPIRQTPAARIDAYGQDGGLWQDPYPLDDQECLVAFAPLGWDRPDRFREDAAFGIYWMAFDGRRELLAADPALPCSQPVPLAPRPRPLVWANHVDYLQSNGIYYLQDIYAGPGLAGVPRGTIKKLRVVSLEFRAAGIGCNYNAGPAGDALVCTPISIGNGAWDVKTVLGEATVYPDGSALFTVPARTPVYFQALDERGCAVQTMRSWSTLQPGEYFGCVGCHEHKNVAPPTEGYGFSLAMKAGTQELEPFYGPPRGFSFPKEIQPILDNHCTRCHNDRAPVRAQLAGGVPPVLAGFAGSKPDGLFAGPGASPAPAPSRSVQANGPAPAARPQTETVFSLLGDVTVDPGAKRKWSDAYLVLTQARPERQFSDGQCLRGDCEGRLVRWISPQSVPEPLPPYAAGAARSELLALLEKGHKGVSLSREELEKIACWIDLLVPYCGTYIEANAWTESEMKGYEHFADKRLSMQDVEQDNIRALLGSRAPARAPAGAPMWKR